MRFLIAIKCITLNCLFAILKAILVFKIKKLKTVVCLSNKVSLCLQKKIFYQNI